MLFNREDKKLTNLDKISYNMMFDNDGGNINISQSKKHYLKLKAVNKILFTMYLYAIYISVYIRVSYFLEK